MTEPVLGSQQDVISCPRDSQANAFRYVALYQGCWKINYSADS